jgi:Tfp pilus assembly protein PilV
MRKAKNGFTLIEIIALVVVMAIVLTPFSILVVNVMQRNAQSQAMATAVSLAEGELERVMALRFSGIANEALAAFAAPFSAYSYQVIVDYVNSGALNTPVVGPTDYKRVQVRVSNAISGAITLTTLAANDW